MFSSGFYMFIYMKKEKMNCFVPAKSTHQVANGLEGVRSLTSVSSTGVDGSGVVQTTPPGVNLFH